MMSLLPESTGKGPEMMFLAAGEEWHLAPSRPPTEGSCKGPETPALKLLLCPPHRAGGEWRLAGCRIYCHGGAALLVTGSTRYQNKTGLAINVF
jgi:hypothetical protein